MSGPPRQHLDEDTLLDFEYGLLSNDAEADVIHHITICATCETRLRDRIAESERLRAAAAKVLGTLDVPVAAPKPHLRSRFRQHRWAIGLPAALACAAAVIMIVLRPGSPPIAPEVAQLHWLPDPGDRVFTRDGGGPEVDSRLEEGLEAYEDRDMESASHLLEAARTSGITDDLRRIYLGSALAWSREYSRAADVLESVPAGSLPEPLRGELLWTLWVSRMAIGQSVSADSLLRALAREPGEIGERARAELRKHP